MSSRQQLNIYEKIGEALKSIRMEKNLTLQQVEDKTQVPSATISKAERGKINSSLRWLIHYANALEINPTEIFVRAFQDDFQNKQLERLFERFGPETLKQLNEDKNDT